MNVCNFIANIKLNIKRFNVNVQLYNVLNVIFYIRVRFVDSSNISFALRDA